MNEFWMNLVTRYLACERIWMKLDECGRISDEGERILNDFGDPLSRVSRNEFQRVLNEFLMNLNEFE